MVADVLGALVVLGLLELVALVGGRKARSAAHRPPHGALVGAAGAYLGYGLLRDRLDPHATAGRAMANTRALVGRGGVEHWLYSAADGLGLSSFGGAYYAAAHLLVTVGVLGWVIAHAPSLSRLPVALLAMSVVALVIFAVFPVAPPRLYDASMAHRLVPVEDALNLPYAAMPSLHCAWAAWCRLATRTAGPLLRRSMAAHVVVTALVVLVTGNHWVVDVVAGTVLAVVTVRAVERVRTHSLARVEVAA